VGRYTAGAVAAQADGADVPAVETNIRRVLERHAGRHLTPNEADAVYATAGRGLSGRDRLLALMDVGALLCRPRGPECKPCPLRRGCATAAGTAALPVTELGRPARQAPFAGSFRQRRGRVLASLRSGPQPVGSLDLDALASLVDDGLALVAGPEARLP
jgi:A/G-specific adenine glycosylase